MLSWKRAAQSVPRVLLLCAYHISRVLCVADAVLVSRDQGCNGEGKEGKERQVALAAARSVIFLQRD